MQPKTHENFNSRAADWDLKPERVRMSQAVAEYIRDKLVLDKLHTRMLDFGCGTGNLSFCLQRYVRSIVAADAAGEMLKQVEQKALEAGISSISTRLIDIEHEAHLLPRCSFDLIASVMALHHIEDTAKLLLNMHGLLQEDGVLCLCDLDSEDGSFHDKGMFIPHHGFDRDELRTMLQRCGYFDITFYSPYIIKKSRQPDKISEYPMFMCLAWRTPRSGDNLK